MLSRGCIFREIDSGLDTPCLTCQWRQIQSTGAEGRRRLRFPFLAAGAGEVEESEGESEDAARGDEAAARVAVWGEQ
jgi:hypothetical protein